MKILLIDNLSISINKLKSLLTDHHVETRIYNLITEPDFESYDMFILTGTNSRFMDTIWDAWNKLSMERRLILESSKPIIGICYGCELIAQVYGSKIEIANSKIKGNYEINLDTNLLFNHSKNSNFKVAGNHRFVITKVEDPLKVLATSSSGIEAIIHKTKPVYGLMFHPEKSINTTEGRVILDAIIKKHSI